MASAEGMAWAITGPAVSTITFPLASVATLVVAKDETGAATGAVSGIIDVLGWVSSVFLKAATLLVMVSCCSTSGVGEASGAGGTTTGAGAGSA